MHAEGKVENYGLPYFGFYFLDKIVHIIWLFYDDAVNLTSELHDPNARMNHLHKRRKQKDLAEGTCVVPAKYPPKV